MSKMLKKLLGKKGAAVIPAPSTTQEVCVQRTLRRGNAEVIETTKNGKITNYGLRFGEGWSRDSIFTILPSHLRDAYELLKEIYEGTDDRQDQVPN